MSYSEDIDLLWNDLMKAIIAEDLQAIDEISTRIMFALESQNG